MNTEENRVAFIEARDGSDAALVFAEQMISIYVDHALNLNPDLKNSVTTAKRYLVEHGKKVELVTVSEAG